MEFGVKKSELLKELQYVQGVVERKATVPILANLLLETEGNALMVTATDLDVTLQCAAQAAVRVSGSLTVSARKLFEIVRLLPEADIHFKKTSEEWVHISCRRSKFKLAVLAKENFPDVPSVQGTTLTLPARPLNYMINHSIFAITQEESRYTLSGALLLVKPNSITLVTTDGHRLALINHGCDVEVEEGEMRVLVPRKTLAELSKLTSEDVLSVEFAHSPNHIFFRVGERLLVSRTLSGQFPNYEMVIPRDNDKKASLNTVDFGDALKRASIMADDQSHIVRFTLKQDQLDISSVSSEHGEARESLSAGYSGEEIEIGFNAQYLLDFLLGLDCEEVLLQLRDQETQGLFSPAALDEYQYSYVVMPIKL